VLLALNKIDGVPHAKLLEMAQELNETGLFSEIFMISALTGDGVGDLRRHVAALMPEGPWLYPEDQIADVPMRSLAAEITREKAYLRLHDELPYALTVETESWEEKKDGSIRIQQVIYVERDSQKKIVLGKGGQSIKTIGQLAREEMQELLETKVHLFLFVKVRENWGNDRERFGAMGLDFPTG
jgi:GTP-binding protein Era